MFLRELYQKILLHILMTERYPEMQREGNGKGTYYSWKDLWCIWVYVDLRLQTYFIFQLMIACVRERKMSVSLRSRT